MVIFNSYFDITRGYLHQLSYRGRGPHIGKATEPDPPEPNQELAETPQLLLGENHQPKQHTSPTNQQSIVYPLVN